MLIELFMLFQLITIGCFIFAFYNETALLWLTTMVFSGMLMLTSYGIEKTVYVWNTTTAVYDPTTILYSYPSLFGINLLLLSLSLIFFFEDMFQFNVMDLFKK